MSDLESVISNAIGGGEGNESVEATPEGNEPVLETSTEPVEAPVETPEAPEAPKTGMEEGKPARRGPIPYQRHEEILAKARADRQAEVEALNKRMESLAVYENQDAKDAIAAIRIMDSDPELFWKLLTQDQRYKPLLETALGSAKPAAPEAQAPSDEPKPDVLNPDGSAGYSHEGLQKLLQYHTKQAEDRAFKRFEERFGPVEQNFQAQAEYGKMVSNAKVEIDTARTKWPKFAENESAIRQAIADANKQGRILPLREAYQNVVIPNLLTDRERMRSELIAEMNAKPTAAIKPQRTSTPPVAKNTGKPRDTEDVIMAAIAGLQ